MKKMTDGDVEFVVRLLKSWRRRLTWSAVQAAISSGLLEGGRAWSRQSLEANEKIQAAWTAAKKRGASGASPPTKGDEESTVARLEAALAELTERYEALMIRHRTLAYNAALLPGGAKMLMDPLPDNSPVTKERRTRSGSPKK